MKDTLYSIVVPVYKSSKSLVGLAMRMKNTFLKIKNADYELIFINDSPFEAKTVSILQQLSAEDENVLVIELARNFGQQAATLCGVECARGDYIITMDDDLQHAPEDIIHLIKKQNHDVVMAKFKVVKHSLFKRITSELKSYVEYKVLNKPRSLKLSSFRLFKASIAKNMFLRKTPFPFIPAILFSLTIDIVNVEVEHHVRKHGVTNYTFGKMLQVFNNLLFNNSSILLRGVGYMGVAIAVVSLFLIVLVLYKKQVLGIEVEGWTSIMLAILFFGGTVLFSLGIIGEYLIRIIATTESRPVYIVKNKSKT